MRRPTPFERVRSFAKRHGVTVCLVNRVPTRVQAPFTTRLGLKWRDLELHVQRGYEKHAATIGGMIHELGHLLAMRSGPDVDDEFEFVTWEWRAALRCDVAKQWHASMSDYGVGSFEHAGSAHDDFGDLPAKEKLRFLRKHAAAGIRAGNLSRRLEPLAVRGPRASR